MSWSLKFLHLPEVSYERKPMITYRQGPFTNWFFKKERHEKMKSPVSKAVSLDRKSTRLLCP